MISQKDFDVIAVGSGHNGLVAAAYLAKAGKRVLVLERNSWLGGGVVSRELTRPGFRHDQHSMTHIFIQANPLLQRDELGLKSRYGLRYLFPDSPMMSVFEDGSTLALYRDPAKSAAQIAKFSQRDAQAFLRLSAQAATWLPMLVSTLYTPPAPQGASFAFLDQSREGREFWRAMQMSSHDVLADYFEHDRVRAHFARVAGENLVSPDEKATGLGVFVFLGFLEAYGFGVPVGGSGKLTEALTRCIEIAAAPCSPARTCARSSSPTAVRRGSSPRTATATRRARRSSARSIRTGCHQWWRGLIRRCARRPRPPILLKPPVSRCMPHWMGRCASGPRTRCSP